MIRLIFLVTLLIESTLGQKSAWKTLNGDEPLVLSRGGFSGLFPQSSSFAIDTAISNSLHSMVVYCDLQLSKDGVGFCVSDINLANSTTISHVFPKDQNAYNVNGVEIRGWFGMDFLFSDLSSKVTLTQAIYSRPGLFDGILPLLSINQIIESRTQNFWLNVEYDSFYTQHKLSPSTFISKSKGINYISSPEINFLRQIAKTVRRRKIKLVFKFQEVNVVEPTTNQTYGSLLKNITYIKSFASGILIPKGYIWPVNKDNYLDSSTSLVPDAHKQGLHVYAYEFANDVPSSYNYSYDPEAEYLQFVDNSMFSVDGVLTDFAPTASTAIGCLAHNKNGSRNHKNLLIISHNGASGIFAASTDLAYEQAVSDGADIIDCSVQMSKDGVTFCSNKADLISDTTVLSSFMSRSSTIPEIQSTSGIFSFDLTWSEIQTLKPQLTSDLPSSLGLSRNPAFKNSGKLLTLQDFLAYATYSGVSGILINIENAAYLASKKGVSIVDTVSNALKNSTFVKQQATKVLIQSDDSAVLSEFKNVTSYSKVFNIKETVGGAPKNTVTEIKKFADAVIVTRSSIIQVLESVFFTISNTSIVEEFHASNISVFVGIMRNEFISITADLFSDPIVEIVTYIDGFGVDGFITEFPGTAISYLRSPCSDPNTKGFAVYPAQTGNLLSIVQVQAPAQAPVPQLNIAEVIDPPLPPVNNSNSQSPAPTEAPSSNGSTLSSMLIMSLLSIVLPLVY